MNEQNETRGKHALGANKSVAGGKVFSVDFANSSNEGSPAEDYGVINASNPTEVIAPLTEGATEALPPLSDNGALPSKEEAGKAEDAKSLATNGSDVLSGQETDKAAESIGLAEAGAPKDVESAVGNVVELEERAQDGAVDFISDATEIIAPIVANAAEAIEPALATDDSTEEIKPVTESSAEAVEPVAADSTEVAKPVVADSTELIEPVAAHSTESIESETTDSTELVEPVAEGATELIVPVAEGATELMEPVKVDGLDDNADEDSKDNKAGESKQKRAQHAGQGKHAAQGKHAGDSNLNREIDVRQGVSESSSSNPNDIVVPPIYAPVASGEQPGYVAAGFGEIPSKKRRRGLKVFGITLGVIVAILLIAYIAGAVVFMGRFLPNTSIGGKDISLKTDAEAAKTLEDVVSAYQLDVVGDGFSYRMSSSDVGLSLDADRVVKSMHADLDAWRWPLLIIQPSHDETDKLETTYKKSGYEPKLTAEIEKFNETAKDPVNATIAFDSAADKFIVQPEVPGTKLNKDAVLASTSKAIDELGTKVSLTDEHLIQPTVRSTDQKLIDAAELATGMVSAHLLLFMGGQLVGEVDGASLSPFVSVNENFEVTFSDEEINNWVDAMADSFNTLGTERVYTRPDGKEIAVSGGAYGWEVDRDLFKEAILDGIRAGKETEMSVPCLDTAQVYNGPGQPDWGARYIDVDISEQYVRFYGDDGEIIWEAPCISGSPDGKHDTGRGVWCVNAKESPSKLIGYEDGKKIYETSVTYWMPFEGNGIGFHDATWQPSFGGSMFANGYGSHGCVNLSYNAAQSLYGIIQPGDVVIVHD